MGFGLGTPSPRDFAQRLDEIGIRGWTLVSQSVTHVGWGAHEGPWVRVGFVKSRRGSSWGNCGGSIPHSSWGVR